MRNPHGVPLRRSAPDAPGVVVLSRKQTYTHSQLSGNGPHI